MTEPNPLEKAEAAAREAAVNTAAVQIALAAVELAKAAQAHPTVQPHVCEHHQRRGRSAGEWIGIACAVCVGSIGLAFASLALAILGGVAAIVMLVLRDMWRNFNKGR
jgi:nucleotide-binding universal stress UspA family protein